MIESKGGESIKGMSIKDQALIEFGRLVAETLPIWGPANIQCFRVSEGRHEVTDVTRASAAASRCRSQPAAATRSSPSPSRAASGQSRASATSVRA